MKINFKYRDKRTSIVLDQNMFYLFCQVENIHYEDMKSVKRKIEIIFKNGMECYTTKTKHIENYILQKAVHILNKHNYTIMFEE